MTSPFLWKAGSILGCSAIALGAYGAHGLVKVVGDDQVKLKNWGMAAHYQLMHSVALIALASIPPSVRRIHPAVGPLILTGTIMFSGSIYLLTLKRESFRALGPVTPLGGLTMMAGWAALLL
ncbi:hypothetical protein BDF20DRAFT_829345 [Mycotypha africana]|uniref:uncharacterized protein n=1 Tax=Mycotypha africana TaxID=64632 RepID=UPI002300F98D|nr:uncharacterized protein BDF20DRAFT_829345 [Mycotypha africana]KAI8967586.1 hypothetical protein BDF20DRAFT_829345 [Mycotypha africana]